MVEYPTFFPCPTWTYQEQTDANLDRALFDCGWARQRRRWLEHNTDVSLAFNMDTQTFSTWSAWAAANGSDWFIIVIDGMQTIMRFTGEIQAQYDAFDAVSVTTTGEIQID